MRFYPGNNSYRGTTSVSSARSSSRGGESVDGKSFASSYNSARDRHTNSIDDNNGHQASSARTEGNFELLNDVSRDNVVVEVGGHTRDDHNDSDDDDVFIIDDDDEDDEDEMHVRTLHPKRMARALHTLIDASVSVVDSSQPVSTLSMASTGYTKRQNAIRRVLRQLPEHYSCLDVGAGPGRFLTNDWPYPKQSTANSEHHQHNNYPSEYVAIERDPSFHGAIRRAMVSRGGAIKGRIIISRKQPSQIRSLHGKKFDLVVFQHPSYFGFLTSPDVKASEGYSIDPIQVITDTIQQFLNPNTGICLVFHYGFGTFDAVYHMFNRDFIRYGRCRYPLLTHLELNMMKVVGGLKSRLSTIGNNRILVEMDQSYCIPLDELSTEKRHVLMSYATQTDSMTLSNSAQKEVWKMLVGSCRQQTKTDDRLLLNHPHVTITIQSDHILEDEEYYEEYFDEEDDEQEVEEETYHPEEEDEYESYRHEDDVEEEYEIEVEDDEEGR